MTWAADRKSKFIRFFPFSGDSGWGREQGVTFSDKQI